MSVSHGFRQHLPWLLFIAAAVVFLTIVFLYDPEQNVWSPKCIMLQLTGYRCPGCGIQRFTYHALHGDIVGAVHYNYFAALLSPYLLLLLSGECTPSRRWRQYVRVHFATKYFGYSYIALYFIWWVLRNILGV